ANAAGRFEQAVASAGAIAGATAEELTRLHDAAIEAGLATQFSPTQATQALQDLAAAGFNVGRALHELGRQGRVNAADSDGRRQAYNRLRRPICAEPRGYSTSYRVVKAALHKLAAEIELATPASERWCVNTEDESESGRVYLELADATPAESARGMAR